ncbi:MAG: hypothetical protein AAB774_02750 [Patescibacteria group bacterium]
MNISGFGRALLAGLFLVIFVAIGCDTAEPEGSHPETYLSNQRYQQRADRIAQDRREAVRQSDAILDYSQKFLGTSMKVVDKQPMRNDYLGGDGWQFVVESKLGRTTVWGRLGDPVFDEAAVGDSVQIGDDFRSFSPSTPGEALSFTRK